MRSAVALLFIAALFLVTTETAAQTVAPSVKVDHSGDVAIIRSLSEQHPGRDMFTDSAIFWSGAYARPIIGKQPSVPATPLASAKMDERRNFQIVVKPVRIEVAASGDMAYEFGTFEASFDLADTKQHVAFQGAELTVWKKENGSWKIAAQFARPFGDKP